LPEPPLGLALRFIERARFFEKMAGAFDNDKLLPREEMVIGDA
jgi:hypothetical protein